MSRRTHPAIAKGSCALVYEYTTALKPGRLTTKCTRRGKCKKGLPELRAAIAFHVAALGGYECEPFLHAFQPLDLAALVRLCLQHNFYDCYQYLYVKRADGAQHTFRNALRDHVIACKGGVKRWCFKLDWGRMKNNQLFTLAIDTSFDFTEYITTDYKRRSSSAAVAKA